MNVQANGLEGKVEVRELVWGTNDEECEEVDVVLMSDVFYDADAMGSLARTLRGVCGKRTIALAASEVRTSTAVCLEMIAREGFEVEEVSVIEGKLTGTDERILVVRDLCN